MTTTFAWKPDAKPTGTKTFAVLTAKFGDGYEQTAADGINNVAQSWPLTFTGYRADLLPIMAFLDACAGWQSFSWTPPGGVQGLYKCPTYDFKPGGRGVWQITATFKQSFQP
jgi:phage-related protein